MCVGVKGDRDGAIRLRLRTAGEEVFPLMACWTARTRLRSMIEVAWLLKRRFENIVKYLRHRMTNASSESINAKTQRVKYTA